MSESVGGMTMYTASLNRIGETIEILKRQKNEIKMLEDKISDLETIITSVATIDTLKGRIDRLFNLYDGTTYDDVDNLLDGIADNSKKIKTILEGDKDIVMPYDTSAINAGYGIKVKQNEDKGNMDICLDKRYVFANSTDADSDSDPMTYYVSLYPGKNFLNVEMPESDSSDYETVIVDIDDTEHPWEAGQSFKIYLVGECSGGMVITTGDSTIIISSDDLEGKEIIELIYMGNNNFIHLIK